ncbi:unnamed protein product [Timema podura]|uniref:MAM domain-containing protein n=1 Tax=Timema podura TaxID=61482 RepID=A0ABN7NHN4_TIMPD|nr:unnamed protein product [Timema podura]
MLSQLSESAVTKKLKVVFEGTWGSSRANGVIGFDDITFFAGSCSNKKKPSYFHIFIMIREECNKRHVSFEPKAVVVNFKRVIQEDVCAAFPGVKLIGCRFHRAQAWWSKIQQKGLSTTYKDEKSEEGKWLHYCFGLTYLDFEDVGEAFSDLMSVQPSDERLTKYMDYLTENYIDEDEEPPFSLPSGWKNL